MSQPTGLGNKAGPNPPPPATSGFEAECERLKLLLADQIEHNDLHAARETVVALLCLDPNDEDALNARALLDEQLALASARPAGELRCLRAHQGPVGCVTFSPDGRLFLTAGGEGRGGALRGGGQDTSVRVWDAATGKEIRRYLGHAFAVAGAAILPDGRRVVSGAREGGLALWDLETGATVNVFGRRVQRLQCLAVTRDGTLAATGSADKTIRLWDVTTGSRVRRFDGHRAEVTGLAFSPDNRLLLSASADGTARLWETHNAGVVHRLTGHNQAVLCAAFSPDGKQALTGSADQSLCLWDVDSGKVVARLSGHALGVNAVAFTPDGRRALSAGSDKTVRFWDLDRARELECFTGHADAVLGVDCSPDGQHALSVGRDTTARLWRLPVVVTAPRTSGLTDEELDALTFPTVDALITAVATSRVLTSEQQTELVVTLGHRFTAPRALAQHLAERDWLTPYQLQQMAEGCGQELRLGNYVLLSRLGEGGMGMVFKARRDGEKQVVALKLVIPELVSDEDAIKQFLWEIQALASMAHPNIIKTYEGGRSRDRYFFTMEYIEGTDLYKLVQKFGPLPIAQACDYVRQAALGLEHAHEHCLIHRDIKPANLLLTLPAGQQYQPGGGRAVQGGVIKILDWGLAGLRLPPGYRRPNEAVPREESTGTADYISPEQSRDTRTADIRADIYSLGCTLYHLLAGQAPFHGFPTMMKLMKHQTTEPPTIQSKRPDVPKELAAIVHRMMAKRPEDRYRTPVIVASALAPFAGASAARSRG